MTSQANTEQPQSLKAGEIRRYPLSSLLIHLEDMASIRQHPKRVESDWNFPMGTERGFE